MSVLDKFSLKFSSAPIDILLFQVVHRFEELFDQTKYKEAAELAAESPQVILRTPDTIAKFRVCFLTRYMGLCAG